MGRSALRESVDILPPLERRSAELGFTTTPAAAEMIRLAARVRGKKLATYLREVVERDASRVVARWQQSAR
ncbi:MAG: hypothetical protein AB7I42_22835 [Bradyrhizobium sp.]|uniref:hypothetical protein n=1 Tax=Bradyrhizobium sp. TaxID=376 RepID=UPI003D122367